MNDNLFYLLREYCKSFPRCIGCKIPFSDDDENGFRCRTEDIDDWSNEEIETYTKLLREWGKNNG